MTETFPTLVTDLPRIDVPLPGVTGWLLQGESRQAVFFRLEAGIVIPEHSHGAQWGLVVEGEIELTIGGEARLYRKGDCYEIPAETPHSARCLGGALALDLFADADRYRAKA
ncbi:MAG: cupin domain-containing protein [Deltaproteobacteria bacterium]|nr:cupin domain-containing protein [Deltaproteobacteria bacterium]